MQFIIKIVLACAGLLLILLQGVAAVPGKGRNAKKTQFRKTFHLEQKRPKAALPEIGTPKGDLLNAALKVKVLPANTTFHAATAQAASHRIVANIQNNSTMQMCVQGSMGMLAPNGNLILAIPLSGRVDNNVPVPAGGMFQFDAAPAGMGRHNGRIQVRYDCNSKCKCNGYEKSSLGKKTSPAIHTLYEFEMDSADPKSAYWDNISNGKILYVIPIQSSQTYCDLIDGLSVNFNATMAGCKDRTSYVTAEQLLATCPASNHWVSRGVHGCISDCKMDPTQAHCCVGPYALQGALCPPSSQFNKKMSPHAYSFPKDDEGSMDSCGGAKVRNIVFSPIIAANRSDATQSQAPLPTEVLVAGWRNLLPAVFGGRPA